MPHVRLVFGTSAGMAKFAKSLRETCGNTFSDEIKNTRAMVKCGGGSSTISWTWGLDEDGGTHEEALLDIR